MGAKEDKAEDRVCAHYYVSRSVASVSQSVCPESECTMIMGYT